MAIYLEKKCDGCESAVAFSQPIVFINGPPNKFNHYLYCNQTRSSELDFI